MSLPLIGFTVCITHKKGEIWKLLPRENTLNLEKSLVVSWCVVEGATTKWPVQGIETTMNKYPDPVKQKRTNNSFCEAKTHPKVLTPLSHILRSAPDSNDFFLLFSFCFCPGNRTFETAFIPRRVSKSTGAASSWSRMPSVSYRPVLVQQSVAWTTGQHWCV